MTCCADRKADGEPRDNPLAEILLESTAALAACGKIDQACRYAGRAYVALRRAMRPWRASTCCCIGWPASQNRDATAQVTPR